MTDLAIRERVAREVMGLTDTMRAGWLEVMLSESRGPEWVLDFKADGDELGCDESREPVPHYESDIAAAWLVVEKMREKGCVWIMSGSKAGVLVSFAFTALGLGLTGQNYKGEGPTAPLAICLAALAALEAK